MKVQAKFPIYLQIAEDIKRRIVIGELQPGDKLPSTTELALQYQINPNTAVRVYKELEQASISYTRRGIGTFLQDDPALPARLRQELTTELTRIFLESLRQYQLSDLEIQALLSQELNRRKEQE